MTTTATKTTASTTTSANMTQKSKLQPEQRIKLPHKVSTKVLEKRRQREKRQLQKKKMGRTTPSTLVEHRSSDNTRLTETPSVKTPVPVLCPGYVKRIEVMSTPLESAQRLFLQRESEAMQRQREHNLYLQQLSSDYYKQHWHQRLEQEYEEHQLQLKYILEQEQLTAQWHKEGNQHLEKVDRMIQGIKISRPPQVFFGQEENEKSAVPPNATSSQTTAPLGLLPITAPASSSFVSGSRDQATLTWPQLYCLRPAVGEPMVAATVAPHSSTNHEETDGGKYCHFGESLKRNRKSKWMRRNQWSFSG